MNQETPNSLEATLTLLWGTHRRQIDVNSNVPPDVAVSNWWLAVTRWELKLKL